MEKIKETVISKFQSARNTSKTINVEVQIEEKGSYPPWAKKGGNAVMFVWDKCLWGPFRKGWRFLERWTNLTFWIFTGIVVGILVREKHPSSAVRYLLPCFMRIFRLGTFNQSSLKRSSLLEPLLFVWSRLSSPHWFSPPSCLVLPVSGKWHICLYMSFPYINSHHYIGHSDDISTVGKLAIKTIVVCICLSAKWKVHC